MNRAELEKYIEETYHAQKDYPWVTYPNFAVFRNKNQKCFAFVMNIPKEKLGLHDEGIIEIVNLKCSPVMIGSLRSEPGFFPAYHMNKEHWITVALDSSVQDDKIKMLVDISYETTAPRRKKH